MCAVAARTFSFPFRPRTDPELPGPYAQSRSRLVLPAVGQLSYVLSWIELSILYHY